MQVTLVSFLSFAIIIKIQVQSLHIRPHACFNNLGTCMFVWECIKTEGKHLGTCADGFLFGSCCAHNESSNNLIPPILTTSGYIQMSPHTKTSSSRPSHQTTIFKPTMNSQEYVYSTKPFTHQTSSKPWIKPEIVSKPNGSSKPYQTFSTKRPSITSSRRPIMSSRKPVMSSKRPITSSKRPITSSKRPITSSKRPIISSERPITSSRKPLTSSRSPITTLIKSSTKKPNTSTKSPFLTNSTKYTTFFTSISPVFTTKSTQFPYTHQSWRPPDFQHTSVKPNVFNNSTFLSTKTTTINLSTIKNNWTTKIPFNATTKINSFFYNATTQPTTFRPAWVFSFTQSQTRSTSTESSTEAMKTPFPVFPCGLPSPHPKKKVVGGKNSAFGSWPWQVSVRRTSFFGFSSTHRCGGALISQEWIATAGHCVDDLLLSQIKIRVGEYDFASIQEPHAYVEKGAKKKVVHPKYNFFTYENDLALVQLEEAINEPHISPICLPPSQESLVGKNGTVTGWGRLSEGGILPSILQEVQVPIISNEKCKNMFLAAGRHEYIPDIFMCAGFEEGGRDSCQGDSGGPLQIQADEGYWFLAGIISWGIGCAEPNMPGVCTRISKFKDWVVQQIT